MASIKIQKPAVGTSVLGKKDVSSKVSDVTASKVSKSATKKVAASKPQEPKKKVCCFSI